MDNMSDHEGTHEGTFEYTPNIGNIGNIGSIGSIGSPWIPWIPWVTNDYIISTSSDMIENMECPGTSDNNNRIQVNPPGFNTPCVGGTAICSSRDFQEKVVVNCMIVTSKSWNTLNLFFKSLLHYFLLLFPSV